MSQTQKQNNEQVEPIFEKKPTNKYEAKAFKPSIADLVKQITKTIPTQTAQVADENEDLVSDEDKKDMAIGLNLVKTPEQKTALLTQADPRNNNNYFDVRYRAWTRDNSKTYSNLASIRSKVSFWIGSTLYANPADKGLPDYVWYLPKDRTTVFRGHFDPKNYNGKNITYTNRRILELRDELQKRIAFWFLIFGLAFGGFTWSATKIHNGYVYVSNKIAAHGDKEKFKQQQLDSLKADAIALVQDYKAGKLTDSQFFEKKSELKARDADINKQ
jgi:hypothetical protein